MNRRGAVLVEVLAAIAIMGISGTMLLAHVGSVLEAQARQLDREGEMHRAEKLLIATALLTRRELEQRLGVRPAGEFLVWVDRPEPLLFRLGISAAARPRDELVATLVYRRRGGLDGE